MRILLILAFVHLGGAVPWSNFGRSSVLAPNTLSGKPFTRSYFTRGASNSPIQGAWSQSGNHQKVTLPTTPSALDYAQRPTPALYSQQGAYSWGYRWLDEYGTQMFREETSDGRGTVNGRYSYREANGILRIVEYIADQYGFRTRIRSNEPGIISSNPANAQIIKFDDENNIPE